MSLLQNWESSFGKQLPPCNAQSAVIKADKSCFCHAGTYQFVGIALPISADARCVGQQLFRELGLISILIADIGGLLALIDSSIFTRICCCWSLEIAFRFISNMLAVLITFLTLLNSCSLKSIFFEKAQSKDPTSYFLNTKVGNIEIDLKLSLLSSDKSWIKSNDCKVCDNPDQSKQFQCTSSCFSSQEQFGIKCIKPHCKIVEENYELPIISKGLSVMLNIQLRGISKSQISNVPMILAERMTEMVSEAGVLNPITPEMKIFKKLLLRKEGTSLELIHGQSFVGTYLGEPIKFEIEDVETLNDFNLGQIKLSRDDPLGTVPSSDQQSFGGIKNTTVVFSTDTQKLLLPKKLYSKVMNHIINSWLAPSESNNKCSFNTDSLITCKSKLSVSSIKAAKINIVLDGIDLSFPLEMLISGIKEKSCSIAIGDSETKNRVIIGDFIFNAFTFQYDLNNPSVLMYRLDNNWGKYYDSNRKHTQGEQYGYFLGFFYFLFLIIWYALKGLFILAGCSILISCYFRRDQLVQWFRNILEKLRRKRAQRLSQDGFSDDKDQRKLVSEFSDTDIEPE